MLWFLLLVALPQPSDVLLLHADQAEETQTAYNYIFTVDGDDTIYTCQANRCSLADFRAQPSVSLTVYQLPEGYQRVATVIDQATLAEYRSVAVASYRLEQLDTDLTADAASRSYHTITIQTDGSVILDTTNQVRNADPASTSNTGNAWLWWFIGGAGLVLMAGLAGFVYTRRI